MATAAVAAVTAVVGGCVPSSTEQGSVSSSELGVPVARSASAGGVPDAAPPTSVAEEVGAPVVSAPPTTATPPPVPTTTAPVDTYVLPGTRPGIGGCPLFPRDNVFHASAARLPVRSGSAQMIAAAGGADLAVKPGFTSVVWEGSRGGYPINVVDSRTAPMVDFLLGQYDYLSDRVPVPMPAQPRLEGWPGAAWDRHLLVVDTATCTSYETFWTSPPWAFWNMTDRWHADTLVRLDLTSNRIRPTGTHTATASGLSMLHGLIRFEEVASGDIDHVLHLTLPRIRAGTAWWPAFHTDGRETRPDAVPMGAWLRLRSDVNLSGLGPQARIVAQALKDHGAILADTGAEAATIMGEPDLRWDDRDLAGLGRLDLADFEIVDPAAMIVNPSTHQIR